MISIEDNNINKQNFDDSQISNLIFVDTNLTNYQSLIPDTNNSNIVLIDSQKNGIEQITDVLEQYSNLASISIFSHGDVGSIQLGNTYLSNENLDNYQDDLVAWGSALSLDGDLLLYGCNVGASLAGLDFVDRVANFTGADIAASEDLTGNAVLGGNWILEVATGQIETPTFVMTEYGSLLDLQFNFTYGTGVTNEQKTAMEVAGKLWSEYLEDNVTLNIHVETASKHDLPDGVIGAALPFFHLDESYSNVRNALAQDVTSSLDNTAVNNLETGSSWSAANSSASNAQTIDIDKVAMTKANAKALGFINSNNSELDGIITFNNLVGTGVSWQYDYFSNNVGSSKLDFTSVATHEIGHILGFVSIIDGMTSDTSDSSMLVNGATTMDLFRYRTYGKRGERSRVLDQDYARFSVDRGTNIIANFSQGLHIDGRAYKFQASHWSRHDIENTWGQGIMDPYLQTNLSRKINTTDLKLMDAIGWDLKYDEEQVLDRSGYRIEAASIAAGKGNINRNSEIDTEFQNWRWARRGSASRLRQNGNVAQFLAQEGFFSVGTFRESFDFSSVNSAGDKNFVVVDNQFKPQEFAINNDLNLVDDGETLDNTSVSNMFVESEGIDYETMLGLVTEGLSNYEVSQLSLDDLGELIQQHLGESVVPSLS